MKSNHKFYCFDIPNRTLYRDGNHQFDDFEKDFPDKIEIIDEDEFIVRIVTKHGMQYERLTTFFDAYPENVVSDYRALAEALELDPSLEKAQIAKSKCEEIVEKRRKIW